MLKNSRTLLFENLIRFCSSSTARNPSPENNSLSLVNKQTVPRLCSDSEVLDEGWEAPSPPSALEEISEDEAVRIVSEPPLPFESFTLQDYVDHSETLQKLVLLGVDLSKVEKRPGAAQFLLKLDFEKDIAKVLLFLKDVGVEGHQLGAILTRNPYLLREDVEDLETRILFQGACVGVFPGRAILISKAAKRKGGKVCRVAYLTSKKFSKEAIARLVSAAPYLLLFSVERLDNRLGFFQKELGLNVKKTRDLITRLPRLLTGSLEPIKENLKVFELELGFSQNEIRHIAYRIPKTLGLSKRKLTHTFDFLHNMMGIPHGVIVHFPQVFNSSLLRIKERHLFLKFLGRAQYDPKQPSYVALDKLVSLSNDIFCVEVAKTSIQDFHTFLKTL
uniref:Transcription termination factor 3, mitochondrial n=1 Tax=Sphaerodactylus townsendi TaxID=933632 RepID=A0ACB8FEV7_9SAUR